MIASVYTDITAKLKTAGCVRAFSDPAMLKKHKVLPLGVVQAGPETKIKFNGSLKKTKNEQTGVWTIWRKRYDRNVPFLVHVGGRKCAETETVVESFLKAVGGGCYDPNGFWIGYSVVSVDREIDKAFVTNSTWAEIEILATGGVYISTTVGSIPAINVPNIQLTT